MKIIFKKIWLYLKKVFLVKSADGLHCSSDAFANWVGNEENEIESDIFDLDCCRDNLKKLKECFDKNSFVPFVGAGTSEITGVPSWKELVCAICEKAGISFSDEDNLLKKASEAKKTLKKAGKIDDYYKCIEEQLKKGTKAVAGDFHIKLAKMFDRFISTNFDPKVLRQYSQNSEKSMVNTLPQLEFEKFSDGSKPFAFLHGYPVDKLIVFEEEIYDHYYPSVSKEWGNNQIEEFLKKACQRYSIIFFGFSFQDQYLFQTFKKIADELKVGKGNFPSHFLIVDESVLPVKVTEDILSNRKDKNRSSDPINVGPSTNEQKYDKIEIIISSVKSWFKTFQDMNVYPILYRKNTHRFTGNILSLLSKERSKARMLDP